MSSTKTLPILLIIIQACLCLWECQPQKKSKKPPATKCDQITREVPCRCITGRTWDYNYYWAKKDITRDTYSHNKKCAINSNWLEVARLVEDKHKNITKTISLGVSLRPHGFNEKLVDYIDWDNSKDDRSHNIMNAMKLHFCRRGISKESGADDFLYNVNFQSTSFRKTFESVPGKEVTYFQLTAECTVIPQEYISGFNNYFHIHFNVFKRYVREIPSVIIISQDILIPDIDIPVTPCIPTVSFEFAKLRDGTPYMYNDTRRRPWQVDLLFGIQLPGIDHSKYVLPPTNRKVRNLMEKLLKVIKLQVMGEHWDYDHDFKSVIADNNTFVSFKIPHYIYNDHANSTFIIYQKIARCGSFVLLSNKAKVRFQ